MRHVVDRRVWLIAGLHVLVLLIVSGRYGFHRDELYFLEAGRHLAFGYVDQPPMVPALARVQVALFGTGVAALRVVPALVSATSVVLAAVLAREFGGGRRTQVLAAGALAGAGFVLATGHLLSTATLDFAFWMALLVVAARLVRTADPRWWLGYGVVAGVALWNKHLVVLLTLSLLGGLALERRRELLASRWLVAGGIVALVLASPTLVWQAMNDWPQLAMAGALTDRLGTENRLTLLPLQLVMLGPVLVAGLVATEGRAPRRALRLVAANAMFSVPLALPVLPLTVLPASPAVVVNDTLVEQVGWEQLTLTVAGVVATLPPEEPVVLLTGSYGEAGALDRYGPAHGLSPAHSGHNSYWHWRQPDQDGATVVAVRMSRDLLDQHFARCDPATTVDNGLGIDNEVQGAPIWVCRGLEGTWAQRWPAFRHYS